MNLTDTTTPMYIVNVTADKLIFPSSLNGISNVKVIQCKVGVMDYSLTSIEEFKDQGFSQSVGSVLLPATAKMIGTRSFASSDITSINLEDTQIKQIGEAAFFQSKLPNIKFPATLESVGKSAFWGAEFKENTLLDLSTSTNLTTIGETAFAQLKGITDVSFPDSLQEIQVGGFEFTKLQNLELPNNLTTLGKNAFAYSETLEKVDLSKTLIKIIPASVFSGQPITTLSLPTTLEEIHAGAFAGSRVPVIDLSHTNLHYLAGHSFYWNATDSEFIKAFLLPPTLTTYDTSEGEVMNNPYAAYYGLNNSEFYNALVTFYGSRLEQEGKSLAYNQFLTLSSDTIEQEAEVHQVSIAGYPYIPQITQHFYAVSKEESPSTALPWQPLSTIQTTVDIKSVEGGEYYIHTNSVWAGEDHFSTLGPFTVLPSPELEEPAPAPVEPQPEPEPEQPESKPEQPTPTPTPTPEQPVEDENGCKNENISSPLEVTLAEEKSKDFMETDAFELKIKLNNVVPKFNIQEVFTLDQCEATLSDGNETYSVGTSLLKEHNRIVRIAEDGKAYTVPHFLDGEKVVVTTKDYNGLYLTSQTNVSFKDIADWHNEEDIHSLYNYLIIKGTTATTYSPNAVTSRAQFAAMIARALELNEEKATYAFKDGATSWYADYVQSLYEVGIIEGYTDGTFRGNQPITRQQASAMIVRMLKYIGVDTSVAEQVEFADEVQINDYAKPAVQYLANQGILVNGTQTKFNPNQPITRNQLAKVLMRALRLSDWY